MNNIGEGPSHGDAKEGNTKQHEVCNKNDQDIGDPYPSASQVRMRRVVVTCRCSYVHDEFLKEIQRLNI